MRSVSRRGRRGIEGGSCHRVGLSKEYTINTDLTGNGDGEGLRTSGIGKSIDV